jgi:DNA-binding response OmpR family regulator
VRILVIEDDPDVLEMIQLAFSAELPEAQASYTDDATEAMRIARRDCPDVIVVDSGVPGMTTEELATELRDLLPDSKLLLYSALDRVALDERASALGLPAFRKEQLGKLVAYIRDDA